jgi:hypothetical protein
MYAAAGPDRDPSGPTPACESDVWARNADSPHDQLSFACLTP